VNSAGEIEGESTTGEDLLASSLMNNMKLILIDIQLYPTVGPS